MNVTVIGMGKIGLPLAVNFAQHGAKVTGLDLQEHVVFQINEGTEPFPGEENLGKFLKECTNNGSLIATTDQVNGISKAEVIVICIPLTTDSNGNPDFQNIDKLVEEIGKHISPGGLVCFETTLPVGTTRNRFTPAIESASGLKVGQDFSVVFSPERVFTGRIFRDLCRYPKLVGGITSACARKGVKFYETFLTFDLRPDLAKPNGVWVMKSAEAAEFAKIAETTYRDVNIGLANEFAAYASQVGVDILEVIQASNSQPYSNIHSPGISVGGHCIPIYSQFYMWSNEQSQIAMAARKRNSGGPAFAIRKIEEMVGSLNGLTIGIMGVSYRSGAKETAFSGSLELLNLLKDRGATVEGFDPLFTQDELVNFGFSGEGNLDKLQGIIVHNSDPLFTEIEYSKLEKLRFIFDGRYILKDLVQDFRGAYLSP
jgi:UDP-N-acetyl-D-glucosamine dehydrogenase